MMMKASMGLLGVLALGLFGSQATAFPTSTAGLKAAVPDIHVNAYVRGGRGGFVARGPRGGVVAGGYRGAAVGGYRGYRGGYYRGGYYGGYRGWGWPAGAAAAGVVAGAAVGAAAASYPRCGYYPYPPCY
jgi:hypothetical protein